MSEERWGAFIAWARRARAKPSFDRDHRDYRLGVAAAGRDLIDAAAASQSLPEPMEALAAEIAKSLDMIVPAGQIKWLSDWIDADERAAGIALQAFADEDEPDARLERFVQALPGGGQDASDGAALVVGSLLNFAISPQRLPVVRTAGYARLRELLGENGAAGPSVVDQYRAGLDFARRVEVALKESAVPVRDMIDVDALIALSIAQREIWVGAGDQAESQRSSEPDVYLAACLMYRNEAPYLAEWLEFHRLVGVERFFLYDNESDDDHLDVLAPYIEEGIVVLHDWPGVSNLAAGVAAQQAAAYDHCIAEHGAEARWIAVLDGDEFLFSPTGRPLPEVLGEYERWPAIAVNTPRFGPSGHVTRPSGLVLENYTIRVDSDGPCHVKSVVDPCAVTQALGAHRFEPRRGVTVDENGYPVYWNKTTSPSFARLRVNHYFARSEQELRAKHARRTSDRAASVRQLPRSEELQRRYATGVRDLTIQRYLPELRAALERRAGRRAVS